MLRQLIMVLMTLAALHGPALALSPPNGTERTTPVDPHQAQPGMNPARPTEIGNTSIQALAAGTGGVVYAGSFGMGIFRSGDRGDTWQAANDGLTDPFVLCLTTGKDGVIYAGTFRGGVFRSRDDGKSWRPVNKGLKRMEIKALMMDAKGLYAGTGDGVYLLNAADDQWKVVTTGLDEILVHALARTTDGTLYAGTSGKGVHSYKERSQGWTRLRQGLRDHEGLVENFIRVLAVDKEQGVYAGTFDGGVFRSGDGGKTWLPISRALPNDSIRGLISNDRGVYVATGRGIFKSVDKGRQWVPLNKGLSNLSVQVLIEGEKGGFYAGTSSGVFRSDDDGLNWTAVSQGLEGETVAPFRFN
jgi:photosystem II stability/assembly factor-like uncharacterized protein